MADILNVLHVSKKVRGKLLLDDVSFTVGKGEICGFVGPNGAGKTTMIRAITSLIKPTSGQIKLNGYEVQTQRKDALKEIGAIVESPIFFAHMTGEKALLNLALLNEEMNQAQRIQKVEEVLAIVGLSERKKDKVSTYSLGMKQRLGIAQALLNNPTVIILDEPANGLDPLGLVQLRELIVRLNQEHGITFFISSHLLDELQRICTHFVMIQDGKVIWKGDKETLFGYASPGESLESIYLKMMQQS
ncbi:MAG: ABC transporter ATP-binding protein [Turicibacter sp.]